MASAKRCQRRERRLLNDIRHVASGWFIVSATACRPPALQQRISFCQ